MSQESSLNQLTLTELINKLDSQEISLTEIYDSLYQDLEHKNSELNIYLSIKNKADALLEAETKKDLPLRGLPIAVKDNFCTKDLPTTASSSVLTNFQPVYESTVTKRVRQAGGVVIGKTNMDAWAHGSSTETSAYGRTLNPRNPDHLPGGSSGGSAAAIAANLAPASLGSETAGSIRQPAAWCGVVGLKPTYGRASRFGVIAMASSTDSPGPICKTVADAALMFNTFAGYDKKDGTSSPQPVPSLTDELEKDISGLKIGVLYLGIEGLDKVRSTYEKQLKVFSELGAEVEMAQALDPHPSIGVYTVVQRAEVSSNLARFDGIRYGQDRSHFGDEAKRRIMLGTYTLSKGYADKYYNLAQKVRTLYLQDFNRLFEKYDLLVSPTSPGFAKKVGATKGAAMFGELEDLLLEPSSISGLPGINIPCYHDKQTNLYLGLNIVAPMFREDLMVRAADAFEKNTPWNSWRK
ncbi:MAG: Asp-tRNA(Asn)/Glu-tRNA(Gln) amidotransferase subunit GatA [Candidatus Pacebacteria bacterium]|nr:Asp-tRNA(Asn)/Glu-tRNA(Gln) amidotransferase subunit GatA [Candidatus Paceibacterota bacterium]